VEVVGVEVALDNAHARCLWLSLPPAGPRPRAEPVG
jgi:hypothetical protein